MKTLLYKMIAFALLLPISAMCSEDSTSVVKKPNKVGFSAGFNRSILKIKSSPYFLEDGTLQSAEVKNTFGGSLGVYYHHPINSFLSMRYMAEANMLWCSINYPSLYNTHEVEYIYPVTVEIPISLIIGIHSQDQISSEKKRWGLVTGIRPVIPSSSFLSSYPSLKKVNLNIDFGITRFGKCKISDFRFELLGSFGLLNMIGKNEKDYRTYSINNLTRSHVGIRLYFN